ncbi:heterogeneous nuclear ribonucleoprotein A2 homolog 1 isoform X2 [Scomber japonicus]|uniref:heterogeneous nuclear ribonucleoprotein A2 homolog 1 isoform X2 n=1 Tax=Scomber japonicus TaxID=13676 RepID=UPI00230555B3|nr:heterogeneous nuclear ribonucleoprotein A2 homolog 1 isoform X2 [Scomber japonicus]
MEENKAPQKRVYISLPKKYMASFAAHYELDHGLVLKDLNPYLNEGYIRAYFREWGTITACKVMRTSYNSGLGYVRFSAEEEADRADWAGPHILGGSEVEVKRVMEEEEDEKAKAITALPRPRRSMGLGYLLEDAQWLDNDLQG